MKKTWVIVVNVLIMVAMLTFVVIYSGIESRNTTQVQIEHFENTTITTMSHDIRTPMMICAGDTVSGTKKRESQSEAFAKAPFNYTFTPIPLTSAGGFFIDSPSVEFSVNNEALYLKLVDKAIHDPSFDSLREIPETGDLKIGFELAHALKGVTANLALTPLFNPVNEITELLRNRTETDYRPYIEAILAKRDELIAL